MSADLTPELLAELRRKAEAATARGGRAVFLASGAVFLASEVRPDDGDVIVCGDRTRIPPHADAVYLDAVSPDVVLALLDRLDAVERTLAADMDEREADAAARVHSEGCDCCAMATEAISVVAAERDELAAEVAAYRGDDAGLLPGWAWHYGQAESSPNDDVYLTAWKNGNAGTWRWKCEQTAEDESGGLVAVAKEYGDAPTPRAAMRAAEAAARARGWLTP